MNKTFNTRGCEIKIKDVRRKREEAHALAVTGRLAEQGTREIEGETVFDTRSMVEVPLCITAKL